MFDFSNEETRADHLGAIWLDGEDGMRFRFEVRGLHAPAPGAVTIHARLAGGRYVPLRIVESGADTPHPRATHVLTHRPHADDPLNCRDVIRALKERMKRV